MIDGFLLISSVWGLHVTMTTLLPLLRRIDSLVRCVVCVCVCVCMRVYVCVCYFGFALPADVHHPVLPREAEGNDF